MRWAGCPYWEGTAQSLPLEPWDPTYVIKHSPATHPPPNSLETGPHGHTMDHRCSIQGLPLTQLPAPEVEKSNRTSQKEATLSQTPTGEGWEDFTCSCPLWVPESCPMGRIHSVCVSLKNNVDGCFLTYSPPYTDPRQATKHRKRVLC